MHRLQDFGRNPRKADRLNIPAFRHQAASTSAPVKFKHSSYRGRFAPSPTGPLHLGSLFTALASYLQARAQGGAWLLRIDDVDRVRSVPGAADAILKTLERFSLFWDGPVVYQSRNLDCYNVAIEALCVQRRLYACTCTRKSLSQWTRYPGICRSRSPDLSSRHALRLITDGAVVTVADRMQGEYFQDFSKEVGDFVVRRSDGIHSYHLASVIDDADAGITEVVRGVDLLESTPRQILLQQALGLPTPEYLHLPVLVDNNGIKLSKQTGAPPVDDRHPEQTLHWLLPLLGLSPSADLVGAPATVLLEWAVSVWNQRAKPSQVGSIRLKAQTEPGAGGLHQETRPGTDY